MYLKHIHLRRLGPIEELTITPRFDDRGQPVPIALVGQNGAGKSLTLATVLDALTEIRRRSFQSIPEVGQNQYLRVSSKLYVRRTGGFSHAQVKLGDDTHELQFDEIVCLTKFDEFEKEASSELLKLPNLKNKEFQASGFYKHVAVSDPLKPLVAKLPFLYFPYFRYEKPFWMSEAANVEFALVENIYGAAKHNPIRANIIEDTKRWILNLILDRELYEKQLIETISAGAWTFLGYNGPNDNILSMVNEIIGTMFRANDSSVVAGRIGIGRKGSREISTYAIHKDKQERIVAPELGQLSSGELMALGLVTEIIRAHELVVGAPPSSLDEVRGVVLVDEIDLHLHIGFQKAVLPALLRRFPKVQFVFTTHSPFFLLGMAETGEIDIYSLPIGTRIAPDDFSEFKVSYDLFVSENERFRSNYRQLSDQVTREGRPLVITEGKTDWQHLKLALDRLKLAGEYQNLDIEFLEFSDPETMGDDKLIQICEATPMLRLRRKVIFVFDRDKPSTIRRMSGEPNSYRTHANSVYSFCIPTPEHRRGYKNITIETYYQDSALRLYDPHTERRLWFSNEVQIITSPTSGDKRFVALGSPVAADEHSKFVFDKPADAIVDAQGRPVGLSKAAFVSAILQNEHLADGISRDSFRLIFDVLQQILADGKAVSVSGAAPS